MRKICLLENQNLTPDYDKRQDLMGEEGGKNVLEVFQHLVSV